MKKKNYKVWIVEEIGTAENENHTGDVYYYYNVRTGNRHTPVKNTLGFWLYHLKTAAEAGEMGNPKYWTTQIRNTETNEVIPFEALGIDIKF